jgi:hypothetical protein
VRKDGSNVRLPRDIGREGFLQSDSSGGPSGRLNPPPNLFPEVSSEGVLGLNLEPLVQVSSESAAPGVVSLPPKPIRLDRGGSESPDPDLGGARLEARQSLAPSETPAGGGGRSPSNRRRDGSRESGAGGNGPSRLQFPANLASSSNAPPGPLRSFARIAVNHLKHGGVQRRLRGSATLTRITRPAKFFDRVTRLLSG